MAKEAFGVDEVAETLLRLGLFQLKHKIKKCGHIVAHKAYKRATLRPGFHHPKTPEMKFITAVLVALFAASSVMAGGDRPAPCRSIKCVRSK